MKEKPKFISLKLELKRKGLDKAIEKRLKERLKRGMIQETKRLRDSGISWKRLDGFGLEYRWTARYLQGKISYEEMARSLRTDTVRFSKKQLAWFKKDKTIKWTETYQEAVSLVENFLQKKEKKSSL